MRGRDLALRVVAERAIDPNDFRTMVSIECSMQASFYGWRGAGLSW